MASTQNLTRTECGRCSPDSSGQSGSSIRRTPLLPASESQTGKSKRGINRCDLLLGRCDLLLLLQHGAHVVILEWAHGFIKTTVASQLNIILCWRMKNLIAQTTEQCGPPSGNPARARSLWTIDPRPLSLHWYNKPSSLSRLFSSMCCSLGLFLLSFASPFVCRQRFARHKSLSASLSVWNIC